MQSSVGLHGPRRKASVYQKGVHVTDSRVSRLMAWRRSSGPEFSVRSVSQVDAEATIRAANKDGAFFFRKSSAESGSMVLSMGWHGQVHHFVMEIPVDNNHFAFDTGNLQRCLRRFVKRYSKHKSSELPGLLTTLVTDIVLTNTNPLVEFQSSVWSPTPEPYVSIIDCGYHEVGDDNNHDNDDIFDDTVQERMRTMQLPNLNSMVVKEEEEEEEEDDETPKEFYATATKANTQLDDPLYAQIDNNAKSNSTTNSNSNLDPDFGHLEPLDENDPLYSQIDRALRATKARKLRPRKETLEVIQGAEVVYAGLQSSSTYAEITNLTSKKDATKDEIVYQDNESTIYASMTKLRESSTCDSVRSDDDDDDDDDDDNQIYSRLEDDSYAVPQDTIFEIRQNRLKKARPTDFNEPPQKSKPKTSEPVYAVTNKKPARSTVFEKEDKVEPVYSKPQRFNLQLTLGDSSSSTVSMSTLGETEADHEAIDATETDL